ncbi:unnamed protein product [Effrenium voratum]|nr:unnamed protein product [Effrenium voratum]
MWDSCDRSCGGGQSTRHRQVQRFPQAGGNPCPPTLKIARDCNTQSCHAQDCTVSQWNMWGPCSVSCGSGQQSRNRYITSLRSADGQGCELGLGMTQKCDGDHFCGKTDCRWGEWSQWSGCTCSCGGGQQTRTRHIARAPRNGGLPCEEGDKEQLAPCNVQECGTTQCRDGQWGEWTEWSPCSVSCGGGVTFRRRRVDIMANECGKEPLGKSKEIQFCDVGVSCSSPMDCELSEWGTWSACSGSCDGIRHRSRVVRVYGRGDGRYCMGGLRETAPCSPSQSEPLPQGCGPGRPQDCLFSQWEGWATCSASCGGGEHTRSRSIAREAKNNGLPCIGALSEISECARHECGGPAPKDCIFGEWEDWGACGKCSGQRHRFRSIVQYPTAGGKECELTNTEQAGKCPRSCHAKQFCGWASWEMWGECSASCGTGYRQRRRQLMLSENQHSVLLGTDMIQEYDSLMQRAEDLWALPGFLISTACATERRSSALEQLATLQRRPQLRTFQRDAELGARGCYSSHLAVYREALESQLPFAMIFEDNLQVTVDQAEARDLLAKAEDFCLEEQPQVLHLSLVHSAASLRLTRHKGLVRGERTSPDGYGPVFIERPPGLGTTGYVICRQAMERLVELDRVQGYQQPIDELLAAQFPETFALFPAVLHRGPAQSLINPEPGRL